MKKIIYFILIAGLTGLIIGYYLYHKPVATIEHRTPDFVVSSIQLFEEYNRDESTANEKYLDKTVQVSGTIIEANTNDDVVSLTLNGDGMFGVICQFDDQFKHPRSTFSKGEQVHLKCICTGLLMDVVMVRCVEVTN